MALTKVGKEGITGISNSSDATAITINSSENIGIGTGTGSIDSKLHVHGSFRQTGATAPFEWTVNAGAADTYKLNAVGFFDNLLVATSTGKVNIGTSAVDGFFQVKNNNQSDVLVVLHDTSGSGGTAVRFKVNGTTVGSISNNSSSTAFNTSSDHRIKENVADMTGAIARVKALAPKRFNFIADADTTVDGFLAHEAQAVVPEAVTGTKNEVDEDGNAVMQGIDQSKLVPLLTGALKEAVAKIEALEARVKTLEDA